MNLDPQLLEILVCPACKSALSVDRQAFELVCTSSTCGLAYPVRDDIPVLLVDEARRPEAPTRSDSTTVEASGPANGAPEAQA